MEEQQAVARLRRGDISGLETLVRLHQVQATRVAYLVTRDQALAEDIMQAAFIRAYERIEQLASDSAFRPWLLRSVINKAIKAAQRRERYVSMDADTDEAETALAHLLATTGSDPADLVETADTNTLIWNALSKLSPVQRAAIVQRYYLGLSEAEMAHEAERPPGTIKWRLHAARKRLRTLLRPFSTVSPAADEQE
jgi:RNA polymerase sigma-70 factor (ECF subfamily)